MKHPGHQHPQCSLAAALAELAVGCGVVAVGLVGTGAWIHQQNPVAVPLQPPGRRQAHQTGSQHDHGGGSNRMITHAGRQGRIPAWPKARGLSLHGQGLVAAWIRPD